MFERVSVARVKERDETAPDDPLPEHLDFPAPRAPERSDDQVAIDIALHRDGGGSPHATAWFPQPWISPCGSR
jgi:hypothetical protein